MSLIAAITPAWRKPRVCRSLFILELATMAPAPAGQSHRLRPAYVGA